MSSPINDITEFITIQIEWHGPFQVEEVTKEKLAIFSKIGVYQIYGNHPINGSNNLLYIGQTTKSFKERFTEHFNTWIKHECSDTQIYLGVIWKNENMDLDRQLLLIDEAEKLLAYYCSPPYNSYLIYDIKRSKELAEQNVMVINLWQKHRLPYEVSTLWYFSDCWNSKRKLLELELSNS